MKKQEENSLDKLFSSLHETGSEIPSAAFLQDLEQRLDAQKKRRKPLVFWGIFSAFGAILLSVVAFNWKNSDAETQKLSTQKTHTQMQLKPASNSNSRTSIPTLYSASSSISSSPSFSSSANSALSTSTLTSFKSSTSSLSSAHFKEIQSSFIADTYAISASSLAFSAPQIIQSPVSIDTNTKTEAQQVAAIPPVPSQSFVSPKQRMQRHAVGLQFGVSGIFSSFEVPTQYTPIAGYDALQFRSEREFSERQTSSWDFNLRYRYQFGKLGMQTGFNYLEWGEQYKYAVISVEGINRYQYVQIPLGVSYQIPIKKVILQPAIGYAIGYGLQTSGTYILPASNGVAQVKAKQFSGNLWAQLELVYQLNEQICVSVAPVYRHTLGNLVDNGLIINRYQSFGLLTGLSYRF